MAITSISIQDFRNLANVGISLSQGLNIICGDNGSGKTSLLEAIYCLGLGRSFRTSNHVRLIRHSTEKFSLFAEIINEQQNRLPVGMERDKSGTSRMRLADRDVASIAELVYCLPLRLINSQSHQLFESGPAFRRRYLDWGVFYHAESFLNVWRNFERALKQRNILLKEKRTRKEIHAWTEEVIKYANELTNLRNDYLDTIIPILQKLAKQLLGVSKLGISYQPGWQKNCDYRTILEHAFEEEYRFGCTQFGPHRADLEITLDNVLMKHFLSRGQQKLLICAMIIAQGMVFKMTTNRDLIYLIDDLPSELDLESRKRLISLVAEQQSQIFITAIESEMIMRNIDQITTPVKVFHVEQGCIIERQL